MMRLQTKRLVLTPLSDAELTALTERTADAHDRAAYAQMLDGCREHPNARLFYTAWEIRIKKGDAIGDACFKGTPVLGETEIGCGLDAAYRGMGYGTEALRALIDWAFGQEGVYYIMAEREQDNHASARMLEKLGFVPAGQGEEGPRFELEKPHTQWLALYLPLGVAVGFCFGTAFDSLALGMCIGAAIGMALGASLSAGDKKKRDALKRQRADRQ